MNKGMQAYFKGGENRRGSQDPDEKESLTATLFKLMMDEKFQ